MSGAPLFSVVTVVLNDREGLRRTAASVKGQSWSSREWVVVDGASSDGTAEVLKEESPDAFLSEKDRGVYDAMNKGAALARGEYIVFMNAGDVFHSGETLSLLAQGVLSGGARPDVIFGAADMCFPSGRRVRRPARRVQNSLWHGLPAMHQSTYYRRRSLPPLPYDISYKICGDYQIVADLLRKPRAVAYTDESLAIFRVGDLSYREPFRLLRESLRVQREILGIGFFRRSISACRRAVAMVGVRLIKMAGK